jgi:UDP-2,4-diacetamido-2,4,6-trideoxy-beta-L-altropyranose hydrolase
MADSLVIRADAGVAMGTGHAMRCLALAQAWQDAGGGVVFLTAKPLESTRERLLAEGMEVVPLEAQPASQKDAEQTVNLARDLAASWIVVDGYHFDSAYQRVIKDGRSKDAQKKKGAEQKLLFVDDTGKAGPYCADLVLNQNLHAGEQMYSRREPSTRLLLGARYTMLRREFTASRQSRRSIAPVARRLLISMGGSDPDNITEKVVQMLQVFELPDWEAIAAVGQNNPHAGALRDFIQRARLPIELERNADMAKLMQWADLAITAGGTTIWELAFMGVPAIAMARGEQERLLLQAAAAQGIALDLGQFQNVTPYELGKVVASLARDDARRAGMSNAGRTFIDGRGASRVVEAMREAM